MHPIEDNLKAALRRKPAPPGFASKVLERIEDDGFLRRNSRRPILDRPWILAVAALIVIAISAAVFEYNRHIRNRNEEALRHTLTAISIAAVELDRAESKVLEPVRWQRLGKQLAGLESNDKK